MGAIELLERDRGPLLIVGGAEDKTGSCVILRELVRLAGDASARIAVFTMASEFPHDVGARYVDVLTRLGAGRVEPVHLRQRTEANLPEALSAVESASAVFFTGGIQSRITRLVGGTHLEAVLHRRWRAGLVVGGTSAGAAAMSEVMIVGSPGPPGVPTDSVTLGAGLGFAPHLIVDQHFSQRRRLGRLRTAVAGHPELLGLGIDEDTAVVLRGGLCEVIGAGAVTVVECGGSDVSEVRHVSDDDDAPTLSGTTLRILTPGDRITLPLPLPSLLERAKDHRLAHGTTTSVHGSASVHRT